MRTTVVTGSFAADHQKPFGSRRHGHDWHVRAAFRSGRHKDELQSALDALLGQLDHGFLDEFLDDPSNEGVAEFLCAQLGATWVYVWRYDRGREFGGEWRP